MSHLWGSNKQRKEPLTSCPGVGKKKKSVSITELICTRKPGFGASLVSWWIDSASKDQPHSKIQQTDGKFHSQQKQWGH